jgi:hypothetical protein
MGLALEVGILADQKDADGELYDEESYADTVACFEDINKALRANGLSEHVEPAEVTETFSCSMFGYSGLHFLRRIAVHRALGKPTPAPGRQEIDYTARLEEYCRRFNAGENIPFQHLIMHSDAEGYYIPIDFERVIASPALIGEFLGSTQRLQAECRELAHLLSIPVTMDCQSEGLFEAASAQFHPRPWRLWPWKVVRDDQMWKEYAVETHACLCLLAASGVSLRTGAAIEFC